MIPFQTSKKMILVALLSQFLYLYLAKNCFGFSLMSEQKKSNIELILRAKKEGNNLVVTGRFQGLGFNDCVAAQKMTEPIEDKIRFYKLKKYLSFADNRNEQSIDFNFTSPSTFRYVVSKRNRQAKDNIWVLAAALPKVGECQSNVQKDYGISLQSPVLHTPIESTAQGAFFTVFFEKKKIIRRNILGQKIEIIYSNEQTKELISTIHDTLAYLSNLKKDSRPITIVETSHFYPQTSVQTLLYNTGISSTARNLQSEYLNIPHWNMIYLLVDQWILRSFGNSKFTSETRLGLTEYISSILTHRFLPRRNLVKPLKDGNKILDVPFDYLSNLLISMFIRTTSVDNDNLIVDPLDKALQKGLRLSAALRSLELNLGKKAVLNIFLRSSPLALEQGNPFCNFRGNFFKNLETHEEYGKRLHYIESVLRFWCRGSEFPDFVLSHYKENQSAESHFEYRFKINHNYVVGQKFMIEYRFAGETKPRQKSITLRPSGKDYYLVTHERIASFFINSGHKLYEIDKFNNRAELNSTAFFPGSAKNLYDDRYLIAWAPTIEKPPSKALQIGLTGAHFKYLWSRIDFDFAASEQEPVERYKISYQNSRLVDLATVHLTAGQADPRSSYLDLSIQLKGLGLNLPSFDTSAGMTLNQAKTETLEERTGAAYVTLGFSNRDDHIRTTINTRYTRYDNQVERLHGLAESTLYAAENFSFSIRLFTGKLNLSKLDGAKEDEFRKIYGFLPYNLSAAKTRIDNRSAPASRSILAVSTDLRIPLSILASGFGLLSDRLSLRLFADMSEADSNTSAGAKTLYRAYGTGLDLPFGSQVMGAGTLVISRFSLLAGMYQSQGVQVSRQPYILFAFNNKL